MQGVFVCVLIADLGEAVAQVSCSGTSFASSGTERFVLRAGGEGGSWTHLDNRDCGIDARFFGSRLRKVQFNLFLPVRTNCTSQPEGGQPSLALNMNITIPLVDLMATLAVPRTTVAVMSSFQQRLQITKRLRTSRRPARPVSKAR